MSRIPPVPIEQMPFELLPRFDKAKSVMGFVPNALHVMAHKPEMAAVFMDFARTVIGDPGDPLFELKMLAAHVSSNVSGCRYCQAHTASNAARGGIDPAKLAHAFEFETGPWFSAAEKSVLRVAAAAGMTPNEATADEIAAMRGFFSDADCVALIAAIALYGFLNRWNDTLATALEAEPARFAGQALELGGWTAGKHGQTA